MAKQFSMDDVKALAEKYKNWGKVGPDDQLGTLNITLPRRKLSTLPISSSRAR